MEMLGTPRVTRVDGTSIAWTEMGKGPPLVLLHGLADSHRTWRATAPGLANRFRVLMPDLPGHGLSSRPDAPYTLEWYAHTLGSWFDAAGVERAHVIGHSFGGGVAQWMLLDGRARVDKLVLVASGGLGREVSLGLRLASLPIVGALAQPFMGVGTHLAMAGLARIWSRDEIRRAAWMNGAPGTGMAFHRTVAGCIDLLGQRVQTWERIGEIDLPPLALLWGTRDPILPIHQGMRARDLLQGAAFTRYDGVGHFPHLEVPSRFTSDVERFLEDPQSPPRLQVQALTLPKRGFFARLGALIKRVFRT
jgi:pimeloyl-ACP methyl ester carboxylesterase